MRSWNLKYRALSPVASHDYRFVAVVDVDYDNLATQKKDRIESKLNVTYTTSDSVVEEQTNKKVMIDVVRQIATENSEKAVALRDQGQIQQAEQALRHNSEYLYMNASKYNSDELKRVRRAELRGCRAAPKAESWTRQRKAMRETQSDNRGQR